MNFLPADFFQQADAWKNDPQNAKQLADPHKNDLMIEKSRILGELFKHIRRLDGQAVEIEFVREILVDIVARYEAMTSLYKVDHIDVHLEGENIRTNVNVVRRLVA